MWATPVPRAPLTHDHLATISGITAGRPLFMQTQAHVYRSLDVVRFLRLLPRKNRGKLPVTWDGAPSTVANRSRSSRAMAWPSGCA